MRKQAKHRAWDGAQQGGHHATVAAAGCRVPTGARGRAGLPLPPSRRSLGRGRTQDSEEAPWTRGRGNGGRGEADEHRFILSLRGKGNRDLFPRLPQDLFCRFPHTHQQVPADAAERKPRKKQPEFPSVKLFSFVIHDSYLTRSTSQFPMIISRQTRHSG